jgi:hypothetical protein
MTITFNLEGGAIEITMDDGDLYITVIETGEEGAVSSTIQVEDVDKFIESIKFLMGSKSV